MKFWILSVDATIDNEETAHQLNRELSEVFRKYGDVKAAITLLTAEGVQVDANQLMQQIQEARDWQRRN